MAERETPGRGQRQVRREGHIKGPKAKKKGKRSSFAKLFWAKRERILATVLVCIFGVLFITICKQAYDLYAVHHQEQELQKQITELKKQNEALQKTKDDLNDLQTVESIAREKLGLVKPGEVPYVK